MVQANTGIHMLNHVHLHFASSQIFVVAWAFNDQNLFGIAWFVQDVEVQIHNRNLAYKTMQRKHMLGSGCMSGEQIVTLHCRSASVVKRNM